jgi:hypothetical protein
MAFKWTKASRAKLERRIGRASTDTGLGYRKIAELLRQARWTINDSEALGDLAIGIDGSLSGEIDGPVWSVSDRGTAGALDRVAQIAERKYCRPHAQPFRLGFPRKVPDPRADS